VSLFLKKFQNLISLVVVVEVFFLDFLAEFFLYFLVETRIVDLLSNGEGTFGGLRLLQFAKLPLFNGLDQLGQINICIKVSEVFHERSHFFMRIALIEFFFNQLLFTVPLSKRRGLLRLSNLLLLNYVTDVLK
jgi:hypothetical protein